MFRIMPFGGESVKLEKSHLSDLVSILGAISAWKVSAFSILTTFPFGTRLR